LLASCTNLIPSSRLFLFFYSVNDVERTIFKEKIKFEKLLFMDWWKSNPEKRSELDEFFESKRTLFFIMSEGETPLGGNQAKHFAHTLMKWYDGPVIPCWLEKNGAEELCSRMNQETTKVVELNQLSFVVSVQSYQSPSHGIVPHRLRLMDYKPDDPRMREPIISYVPFDELIESLRKEGFEKQAHLLKMMIYTYAWTTGSELLGELGQTLKLFETELSKELPLSCKQKIDAAFEIVKRVWHDFPR
jgi:hypothetical protein